MANSQDAPDDEQMDQAEAETVEQEDTEDAEEVQEVKAEDPHKEFRMDISESVNDNTTTYVIASHIPDICKTEPCCLGIDEAGRGPVLGPMVYGICFCPISMKEKLANLGFADSKTLKESDRDKLMKVIEENHDFIGWSIKIISSTSISNDMLKRCRLSLNQISHDAAIELTKKSIADGADIKEMFVDTVGPAEKYQEKLSYIFPKVDVTVESKADAKFPCVSAASICAKVSRDRCIKQWKFTELEGTDKCDMPYGSGYPADPDTKKWLASVMDPVFGFPQFVRFSWSTASIITDKDAVAVSWEDEDDDENSKGMAKMSSYFSVKKEKKEVERCIFFKDRNMVQCSEL